MPSVAQESPAIQSGKKRRLDDDTHQVPLLSSASGTSRVLIPDKTFDHNTGLFHAHHSSPLLARKIVPFPSGKRQRTTVDRDLEAEDDLMQRSPSGSPHRHELHHHRRQQPYQQTKSMSHGGLDAKTRPQPSPAGPALMSRCHICSRKPNKKSDLDSFADCQGCGQRTCYVCIRECLGWGPNTGNDAATATPSPTIITPPPREEGETSFTMLDADAEDDHPPVEPKKREREHEHEHGWTRGGGHRQVVCSRCCVERGQDGEVVCLGCLPFVES